MKSGRFEIRRDDLGLTCSPNSVSVPPDELDARTNPSATQTRSHDATRLGGVARCHGHSSSAHREQAAKSKRAGNAPVGHSQQESQTGRQQQA